MPSMYLRAKLLIATAALVLAGSSPAVAAVRHLAPARVRGAVVTFDVRSLQTLTIRSAKVRAGAHRRSVRAQRLNRAIRRGVLRVRLRRSWTGGRRGKRLRRWARKRVRLVVRTAGSGVPPVNNRTVSGTHVYAYYYLWWSTSHWHDKLGSSYPYGESPLPLPATLDSSGCGPVSRYPGNQLTDVPAVLYSQDDPGLIEQHVRAAAGAGLSGFLVNWAGTGTADQTKTSVTYSRRLDAMFSAVRKVNAQGIPFKIVISLKDANVASVDAISNDLSYLERQYGNDSAYDHTYSNRPMLIWTGSRKHSLDQIRAVSERFRRSFFLLGDETESTWSDGRATYFDGNHYYWSTQDPYGNPHSFSQLRSLAGKVRASGPNPDGSRKLWFAPVAPGYNSQLNGGSTCVPRKDGETMRLLFNGNSATNPDGWTLISWNEIAEGSYIEPLQRYGTRYLQVLSEIIRGR
jgi:hypothetical protein